MDEAYLLRAARYTELNPVRAKLVGIPQDYIWSSARAHLGLSHDDFVRTEPLLQRVSNWNNFLAEGTEMALVELLGKHQRTGRPLGSSEFIKRLESQTGRSLLKKKPGPKPLTITTLAEFGSSRVSP
ncbi:MAG TPA: hypothetical protein VI895_13530 [Bdellovibrionota bacterium]|nr:hypothetical protein [Bdellovibrionota bacterium]